MRRAYLEALGFANLCCSDGLDACRAAELQSYPTEAVLKRVLQLPRARAAPWAGNSRWKREWQSEVLG